MAIFNTPASGMTQYDRPKVGVIQQGPRPESEGRRMVRESMEKKAAELKKRLGR